MNKSIYETYFRNPFDTTADGENTFVDAGYDLAHASLDASLLAEVSDVFTTFSNDDTCVLGADESTQSKDLWTRRLVVSLVIGRDCNYEKITKNGERKK